VACSIKGEPAACARRLAVINRFEIIETQQAGKLAGIYLVALVTTLE